MQAHRLGMQYPKYVFLTYGTYEQQWWISQSNHSDNECSSDDIAYTLQYSLAVTHFNTSMRNNMFYHVYYDAVLSLAYALERVVENESGYALRKMNDKIQCIDNSYTKNISSLVNEELRNTNFVGSSVSTTATHKHSHHRYTLDCFTEYNRSNKEYSSLIINRCKIMI